MTVDSEIDLQDPFNLHRWIEENRAEIDSAGFVQLFGDDRQFFVSSCIVYILNLNCIVLCYELMWDK